jgi:hypothetical protein
MRFHSCVGLLDRRIVADDVLALLAQIPRTLFRVIIERIAGAAQYNREKSPGVPPVPWVDSARSDIGRS